MTTISKYSLSGKGETAAAGKQRKNKREKGG
jgi:hypothetical protein